jgi:hypothetical protein
MAREHKLSLPDAIQSQNTKIKSKFGEISGYHGGKYEDDCLLGCCKTLCGSN